MVQTPTLRCFRVSCLHCATLSSNTRGWGQGQGVCMCIRHGHSLAMCAHVCTHVPLTASTMSHDATACVVQFPRKLHASKGASATQRHSTVHTVQCANSTVKSAVLLETVWLAMGTQVCHAPNACTDHSQCPCPTPKHCSMQQRRTGLRLGHAALDPLTWLENVSLRHWLL